MGAVCHPVLLLAVPCTAAQLLQEHTIRQAVVEQGAGSCVGWGDGLGAGWGSLQPHCTCRNTGRLGVLPLWDVPQCAHGVKGQRGAELSVHAASLQLCVPRVAASASQRAPRAPAAQNSSSGAVIPPVLARGSPSGTGREAAHRHGEMGNSRPRAAFFPVPAKKRDAEQTGEKKRKNKTHIGFRDGLFTGRIDAVCVQKS